jgi:hypothetical protein
MVFQSGNQGQQAKTGTQGQKNGTSEDDDSARKMKTSERNEATKTDTPERAGSSASAQSSKQDQPAKTAPSGKDSR